MHKKKWFSQLGFTQDVKQETYVSTKLEVIIEEIILVLTKNKKIFSVHSSNWLTPVRLMWNPRKD